MSIRPLVFPAMVALTVAAAACGDSGTSVTPLMTATPSGSAVPSDSQPSAPSAEPSPAAEPVDLVVLAASGGGGVAERYAPLLADALGREVRNQGHLWSRPTEVLDDAANRADVVAGAEAILIYFPPIDYEPPGFLPCLEALGDENGDPGEPPVATTAEDWQAWRHELDRDYEAIWSLRDGQPTIIRSYGGWNPWLAAWRRLGIASECIPGLDALDEVEREAAETHGAVHVSMLDLFNGPRHDQEPAQQGWIDEDGMHLSDSGKDVLVEALAAVGFEASEPGP